MITIHILEVSENKRLHVSWREGGLCNYTEQIWCLRTAERTSYCAISGKRVLRGDKVYQPVGNPINHATYILAEMAKVPMKYSAFIAQVNSASRI